MFLRDQRDARWWFALNGILRQGRVRGLLPATGKTIVVNEYPKSGGTWFSQMLSAILRIPYPRNRLPMTGSAVMHGSFLDVASRHPTVVVHRDGRDIMVSYYFHLLFPKVITSEKYVRRVMAETGIADPNDVATNLPNFMQWVYDAGYPRFTWPEFVTRWYGCTEVVETRYETLRLDTARELQRIVTLLTGSTPDLDRATSVAQELSFEAQSGRTAGTELRTDFLRKGVIGDWKTYFTPLSCDVFRRLYGDTLVRLGYESDDGWTSKATPTVGV